MTRIFRNSVVVMIGTLASRLLGVLRQIVFNNAYASDTLKDAFNVAYRVPNLFRELLAEGGVQNALIPVLKSLPDVEVPAFARRFGALLLGLNLAVIGLCWVAAPWLAGLLISSGSPHLREPQNFQTVVLLMRLALPFLLGISMSALFTALLQADERFAASSFSPLAFNLGSMALMLLWPGDPVMLGLSVTVGGFLQALVQLPYLRGFGLEFKSHPALGRALARMGPFVFTTSTRQVLNLVLVNILTFYPQATVTGFYNAELVYLTALGVLAVSPAMAAYPRMSELYAKGDLSGFNRLFEGIMARVAVLLGLASSLMGWLAPWLTSVFAWTANFSEANRSLTTLFLLTFSFSLVPWGLNALLVRGFYAVGEVQRAVRISVLVVILNTLGYWLLKGQSLYLLNAATALAGLVGMLLYARRLGIFGHLRLGWLVFLLARVALAALVSGAPAYFTARLFGPPQNFFHDIPALVVAGGVGLLVYMGVARALRLSLRG
ncbi:murein biosynthesis integral membrane protein MurJ [Allomeiothermus silvanus]|uniref:murein biosynthesis integral membrane protein MurJ n=1 Tax=Allomeiothermus silvanus TaxID=52022 RepID=UPI0023F02305|nr:murein biosynthesis integral membrane protein MurJ [Allomeiothermus silvanus]